MRSLPSRLARNLGCWRSTDLCGAGRSLRSKTESAGKTCKEAVTLVALASFGRSTPRLQPAGFYCSKQLRSLRLTLYNDGHTAPETAPQSKAASAASSSGLSQVQALSVCGTSPHEQGNYSRRLLPCDKTPTRRPTIRTQISVWASTCFIQQPTYPKTG